MKYWINFDYCINDSKHDSRNDVCFGILFRSLNSKNSGFISIYMYSKINLKLDYFKQFKEKIGHVLRFDRSEIEHVYSRLSDVVDMPEIEAIDNEYGKGFKVTFKFENKSQAWVKTICTISRYFYEKYFVTEGNRDLYDIMRDTIDYCKTNPEASFIETFQLFHYDSSTSSGHACLPIYPKEYPIKIVSQESFVKRMNDFNRLTVYGSSGVFLYEAHKGLKPDEVYSFDNVSKI